MSFEPCPLNYGSRSSSSGTTVLRAIATFLQRLPRGDVIAVSTASAQRKSTWATLLAADDDDIEWLATTIDKAISTIS
jgi:hypothetical protein